MSCFCGYGSEFAMCVSSSPFFFFCVLVVFTGIICGFVADAFIRRRVWMQVNGAMLSLETPKVRCVQRFSLGENSGKTI